MLKRKNVDKYYKYSCFIVWIAIVSKTVFFFIVQNREQVGFCHSPLEAFCTSEWSRCCQNSWRKRIRRSLWSNWEPYWAGSPWWRSWRCYAIEDAGLWFRLRCVETPEIPYNLSRIRNIDWANRNAKWFELSLTFCYSSRKYWVNSECLKFKRFRPRSIYLETFSTNRSVAMFFIILRCCFFFCTVFFVFYYRVIERARWMKVNILITHRTEGFDVGRTFADPLWDYERPNFCTPGDFETCRRKKML